MREELMLAGWKVAEAGNGIEALRKCEESMPGLILLDLMMPVMDGFAFLEELRHRPGGGSVPVLVVTARDLTDDERRRLNRSLAQVLARESLTREQLLDLHSRANDRSTTMTDVFGSTASHPCMNEPPPASGASHRPGDRFPRSDNPACRGPHELSARPPDEANH